MEFRKAETLGSTLIEYGVYEIDVLGGEPLLVPWIKHFAERMTGAGVTLNISTNGSLPEAVDGISDLPADRLNIGFSLHGLSETHNLLTRSNNFSKAVAGIQRMVKTGKNPVVKSTLTRENASEICRIAEYLIDTGVKKYFLLHEDIIGRDRMAPCFSFPRFFEFYLQIKEKFRGMLDIGFVAASCFHKHGPGSPLRCDAGTQKIAIMPDGSAFPCNLCAGLREFRLGNIFRDGMDEICRNPVIGLFRRRPDLPGCRVSTCVHRIHCSGGCPAHIRSPGNKTGGIDPRCAIDGALDTSSFIL